MASGEKPYVVDMPERSQHQKYFWRELIQNQVMKYNQDEEEKRWTKTSIYHLPDQLTKKMEELDFTPQVVSFGPYHHGNPNLKHIEHYKQNVLVKFLHKARRPLIDFVIAIEQVLEELQRSYDWLEDEWITDEEKFVKLMIMDGCFMLEILRLDPRTGDYPINDPIFSLHGAIHKLPHIKKDMLMLENQIPLLVLKVLMQVVAGESRPQVTDGEINELVYNFYNKKTNYSQEGPLGLHVLDLFRKSMIITADISPLPVTAAQSSGVEAMLTAVKLRECGVQFQKSDNDSISFDNGVLKLPILTVDDSTKSMLLNLVAFEHLHVTMGSEISAYIYFMDKLVDSEQDVHLLTKKGIINICVGSEAAVATILNSLTEEITLDPTNEFADVSYKVFKYSERTIRKKIHKWWAILMQKHFNNPWSALAVVSAILLLVMTAVQTVYAVIDKK